MGGELGGAGVGCGGACDFKRLVKLVPVSLPTGCAGGG